MSKRRKATVCWSKEKIAHLIVLYRKHECLWNHFINSYKCKEKRTKAIEEICSELKVTKFDFGKKIHNLRNQFNSEMKKLEKRMEVSGEESVNVAQRCRWEHFESLMFLKDIIEPRPGYQSGFPPPKKMRLKYSFENEGNGESGPTEDDVDVTEYHFEEAPAEADDDHDHDTTDDFHTYEVIPVSKKEMSDHKYNPASPNTITSSKNVQKMRLKYDNSERIMSIINKTASDDFHTYEDDSPVQKKDKCDRKYNLSSSVIKSQDIELPTSTASRKRNPMSTIHHDKHQPVQQQKIEDGHEVTKVSSTDSNVKDNIQLVAMLNSKLQCKESSGARDQWDQFGELIANEFRNLSSDVSRKKLKRRIMACILEIGEQDDELLVAKEDNRRELA